MRWHYTHCSPWGRLEPALRRHDPGGGRSRVRTVLKQVGPHLLQAALDGESPPHYVTREGPYETLEPPRGLSHPARDPSIGAYRPLPGECSRASTRTRCRGSTGAHVQGHLTLVVKALGGVTRGRHPWHEAAQRTALRDHRPPMGHAPGVGPPQPAGCDGSGMGGGARLFRLFCGDWNRTCRQYQQVA